MARMGFLWMLMVAGPAWAGWVSVAEDGTATTYADPESAVRSGAMATMWSLADYRAFHRLVETGYWSQRNHVEYDCGAGRSRHLVVRLHAQRMGEGKVVYEDESARGWETVEPGSVAERLLRTACR